MPDMIFTKETKLLVKRKISEDVAVCGQMKGARYSGGPPQHELIITEIHILVGNYIFQGYNLHKPLLGNKFNVNISFRNQHYADH